MDEQIYAQKRRSLTDAFEQTQAQRDAQWAAEQSALDAERNQLAADRERANRNVYVRQEQAKAQLPEQLSRLGINGGAAETNLLRMNNAFNNERGQIEQSYQAAVQKVNQTADKQRAAYQNDKRTAEQTYYDRLTDLAQELAEAQQTRAEAQRAAEEKRAQQEAERAWTREKYQMQVDAAREKAQIAADLAREKARIAAASKTSSSKSTATKKSTKSSKSTSQQSSGKTQQSGVRYLSVPTGSGMQRLTRFGGRTYANPVQFDGSGAAKIQVGSRYYTVDELQKALRDGTVVAQSGPLNSSRYVAAAQGVAK